LPAPSQPTNIRALGSIGIHVIAHGISCGTKHGTMSMNAVRKENQIFLVEGSNMQNAGIRNSYLVTLPGYLRCASSPETRARLPPAEIPEMWIFLFGFDVMKKSTTERASITPKGNGPSGANE
jgi:hypothetical protein